VSLSQHLYIYVYIYIEREREREFIEFFIEFFILHYNDLNFKMVLFYFLILFGPNLLL